MDAQIKADWLKALRSGEYEQGKEVLRTSDNKFCCLGVLCDLMDKNAWSISATEVLGKGVSGFHHMTQQEMPSTHILDKAGFGHHDAIELSEMNDDGLSFEHIAAHIEARF